jgi:hypothetical protein
MGETTMSANKKTIRIDRDKPLAVNRTKADANKEEGPATSNRGPAQVLIIRHGEKVGNPKKEDDGGPHLSIQGSARAAGLPSLFVPAMPQSGCKLQGKSPDFSGKYHPIPIKGTAPPFSHSRFHFRD